MSNTTSVFKITLECPTYPGTAGETIYLAAKSIGCVEHEFAGSRVLNAEYLGPLVWPDSSKKGHREAWMDVPQTMKQLNHLRFHRVLPKCPKCGKLAEAIKTEFGAEHRCCGLRSRSYKPLVTEETLAARVRAHEAFDRIWKEGHMTRNEAYEWLASEISIPRKRCHMAMMTESEAFATRAACGGILAREEVQR